jgi:hypothetical protein
MQPTVTADVDPDDIFSRSTDSNARVKLPPEFADMDVTVAVLKDERADAPRDAEHHNAPKDGNDDPVLPDAAQGEPAEGRCPECGGPLRDTLGGRTCVECGETFADD